MNAPRVPSRQFVMRNPNGDRQCLRHAYPAHQTVNGVTTAKRVAGPVCRDRQEPKNAPLGWLLREVQAAQQVLEARVVAQGVVEPELFQPNQEHNSVLIGLFQGFKSLFLLAETEMDVG